MLVLMVTCVNCLFSVDGLCLCQRRCCFDDYCECDCHFQRLEEEHQAHAELRVKYQKLSLDYAEAKGQLKTDDYKVENYDKVK